MIRVVAGRRSQLRSGDGQGSVRIHGHGHSSRNVSESVRLSYWQAEESL